MIKPLLCIVAFATPFASYAKAPNVSNGVMVDENGMTLYTFDKDTEPGKSACTGECTAIWPAAIADEHDKASGGWSFVTTVDGQKQWTYKGHPLAGQSQGKKNPPRNLMRPFIPWTTVT